MQTRAKPGAALQTAPWFIHSFIQWVSEPFPPIALQRRHAKTVRDSTSISKIVYGQTFCDLQTLLYTFLNFLVNITK